MAISLVAFRQALTSTIVNLIIVAVNRLTEKDVTVEMKPVANTDSPSSTTTFDTWITLPSVTVPAWATSASYSVDVAGIVATASISGFVRLAVGAGAGLDHAIDVDSTTIRTDMNFSGRIASGIAAGSQDVIVQFKENSGGSFRADTNSHIGVTLRWA